MRGLDLDLRWAVLALANARLRVEARLEAVEKGRGVRGVCFAVDGSLADGEEEEEGEGGRRR